MHADCNHFVKICKLHDGTTDIFEDGGHSGDLKIKIHGLPAAVKEKAVPLFEGTMIILL